MSGGHMTPCSTCKHSRFGPMYQTCKAVTYYSPVSGKTPRGLEDARVNRCKGELHEPTFWVALKAWLMKLRKG